MAKRKIVLIRIGVAFSLIIHRVATGFLPRHQHSSPRRRVSLYAKKTKENCIIHYSPNFHRYVVVDEKKRAVQESFLWLDEAKSKYPKAKIAPLCTSMATLKITDEDHDGSSDTRATKSRKKRAVVELTAENDEIVRTWSSVDMVASEVGATDGNMYDIIRKERVYNGKRYIYASNLEERVQVIKRPPIPPVAGGGLEEYSAFNFTKNPDTVSYFSSATVNKETMQKYQAVIEKLNSKLSLSSSSFFDHFPKSDHGWIQERILFFLSPQQTLDSPKDWVRAFCVEGYGVGLSESQTATLILALRHLLQFYPRDSSSGKPDPSYFYQTLKVSFDWVDQARAELSQYTSGSCSADLLTFAFLNSLNVSPDQCRIILEALSISILSSELEPNWDMQLRKTDRPVRKQLDEESLYYLRMRLHLSPSQVVDMIKTHSRLSSYSKENIKLHLDALQSRLQLTSQDLRSLAVKAPSLLGISVGKLEQRILFLREEVSMTDAQIQKSILQVPSLLQYSIESNLVPKVKFLKDELGLSKTNLTKIVVSNPSLLGRSLNNTFIPVVQGFQKDCGLSLSDIRTMTVQVPQIFTSNWQTNLKQKIIFFKNRLGLSEASLRGLLKSCPRLLVHSIATSLEPKLKMLEQAAECPKSAAKIVCNNPSLLLTNRAQLDRRIVSFSKSNFTFEDFFTKESKVPEKRKKKAVLEFLEDGNVARVLTSVEDAALEAGTSKFNMYNIIKTKRLFQGKRYAYGSMSDTEDAEKTKQLSSSTRKNFENEQRKQKFLQDFRINYVPEESSMRLAQLLQSGLEGVGLQAEFEKNKRDYLAVFVASQTYPPKQMPQQVDGGEPVDGLAGKRRAGGHAIYIPQLQGVLTGGKILRGAAESCLPNLMPCEVEGTSYAEGLMLLGYPYTRPTRNRCTMYAFRDALRVVLQLLLNNPDSEFKNSTIHVDLFTDSNYAFQLLHNPTNLLRWGAFPRKEDFVYDGEMPEWKVNKDILYPLARTYYRLSQQDFVISRGNSTTAPKQVAGEIKVRIRHKSELGWSLEDNSRLHSLGDLAGKAAAWQHERANAFVPKMFV